jgi:hypothetical protein
MSEFAVMILTHGRPDKQYTLESLRKHGYNGDIILVIDNEDQTLQRYKQKYSSIIEIFDKNKIANETDEADNFNDRRAIIYARNASFSIAKKKNLKYWIQLDDDYTGFEYRLYEKGNPKPIKSLDKVFSIMLDFYKKTEALSIAMAQGGDYIGGKENNNAKKPTLKRKCMNSFICSSQRPFQFIGRVNEDVNTYTTLATRGKVFFTIPFLAIVQKQTQMNSGGMTEMYIESGTYVKSFYTVIHQPSSVKIKMMGDTKRRLHHSITWKHTTPVIMSSKHKK